MTDRFPRWLPAYVGIGSNLADPGEQVRRAIAELANLPSTRLVSHSPSYQTQPFGPVPQPAFVNAVAGLLTRLSPEDLLGQLRELERKLGRERSRERWGPRVIDLDLLAVGDERRDVDALKLPHPGIAERDFVLHPLADIAPQLELPGLGAVWRLRDRVTDRGVRRL